ncbi:GAF and ANTAR domain-containing protein [Kitasatospora purpeofusca]|uniref:GAF and ANTAR domain-containing protein n=1 Tax=Kitasatospora purpeofusca TaxID=67352 RepID=UPI002A5AF861|nr:GAF and ANTAR domain-containing protein [Kitasatospora purpeofusca]MDY0814546.1 GAF and ANTAR domain-containing protein [Kitasatospora purpeofusca]
MEPERRQTEAFAGLTESLVTDFDLAEILTRVTEYCVTLCSADGAGIVVVDADGSLRDIAYSGDAVRRLESFQTSLGEGPCVDCVRTGRAVTGVDLTTADERWPRFAPAARRAGYASARALPLRVGSTVVGALNLFDTEVGDSPEADLLRAQTLADLAVIALVQHGAGSAASRAREGVAHTLRTRSLIERAKGILAESGDLTMDQADLLLRTHARNNGDGSLSLLAEKLVGREVTAQRVLSPTDAPA